MDRQIGEGCFIQSPEAEFLMNGKLDHMQPVEEWWSALQSTVVREEPETLAEPGVF